MNMYLKIFILYIIFHPNHGENIILREEGSVAYRTIGFDNGLVFSKKHLEPGELFVVEIEQNEQYDWTGYLRLGLTQVNPSIFSSRNIKIPKQAVADLTSLGASWVYGLDNLFPYVKYGEDRKWPNLIDMENVEVTDEYIKTCYGSYSRLSLRNSINNLSDNITNIDIGYKVGVVYIPTDDYFSYLYYLINGNLFGPFAVEIPYKNIPLYAVVDVYAKTKQVRLLQIQADQSLRQLCRTTIHKMYDMEKLNESSLPKQIIDYLNFESDSLN